MRHPMPIFACTFARRIPVQAPDPGDCHDFTGVDLYAADANMYRSTLRTDLQGRIHVIVGTADTFYLDGGAHRFDSRLRQIGARLRRCGGTCDFPRMSTGVEKIAKLVGDSRPLPTYKCTQQSVAHFHGERQ